jgi:hypothetical protein
MDAEEQKRNTPSELLLYKHALEYRYMYYVYTLYIHCTYIVHTIAFYLYIVHTLFILYMYCTCIVHTLYILQHVCTYIAMYIRSYCDVAVIIMSNAGSTDGQLKS